MAGRCFFAVFFCPGARRGLCFPEEYAYFCGNGRKDLEGMDEREFLSGVNRKDERAWKELYDCFYAPLCCYSARISKDGTEAEDVVQDCLVKLWHSEVKFEDMKVITSYLYRAVYRATLNAVRDRERDRRIHERWVEGLAEDEGWAAEMALEEEAITRFHKVLELLPGQQRDILLHCMKGEKVREIAEALGVSENTVKTQKKRAYEFVRDELGELWGVVAALFFM